MSTENETAVARPYAVAAFEYALEKQEFSTWETFLNAAAELIQNPEMRLALENPKVTKEQIINLINEILAPVLDPEKQNFIHLLAENKRLFALPSIASLFKINRAQHEKIMNIQITSAVLLDENYQTKFEKALTARFKQKVVLDYVVDKTLLGGAIIRAGDTVIDGSVVGKLNRLLESIY